MQETVQKVLVSQDFSCPLCMVDLGLKSELLFCQNCNIFMGNPETFHHVQTRFDRERLRAMEREQFRRSASTGVFPRRAIQFVFFYVGLFLVVGVLLGTMFGAGMALAIKGSL
jgi:hypothetical protein